MPERNSWDVSYSSISFLERALNQHSKVAGFERRDDILFVIERIGGLSEVRALLVNEYTVGVAAVHRARDEFPTLTCIVTAGDWNGYTREAKELTEQSKIGLFVISEFLGALNLKFPHTYVKKDDRGRPTYRFKSA